MVKIPSEKSYAFKLLKTSHNALTKADPQSLDNFAFPDKLAVLEELNGEIKIRALNIDGARESTVHPPPQQWANGVTGPIDPLSVLAIRATS